MNFSEGRKNKYFFRASNGNIEQSTVFKNFTINLLSGPIGFCKGCQSFNTTSYNNNFTRQTFRFLQAHYSNKILLGNIRLDYTIAKMIEKVFRVAFIGTSFGQIVLLILVCIAR